VEAIMGTVELEIELAGAAQDGERHEPAAAATQAALPGVIVGMLIGFRDDGATPLVLFPGQPGSAAIAARATLDVHGVHIGRKVLLLFENGDARLPIITGLLQQPAAWPLAEKPAQVEVQADGDRLLLDARQKLVLRCGKASITLTREGKVLIQGSYISSRSSGVNRIKGGSVQLN
jgi:hypothetical protein